jgi:alkaline phosphatase D
VEDELGTRALPGIGPISRRTVLAGMAAVGLAACLPEGTWAGRRMLSGVEDPAAVAGLPAGVFTLGVASGDPRPNGFVLWTRLAPKPLEGGGMPNAQVPVRWQLATDRAFRNLVADGQVTTGPAVGHSVHVEVEGLPSGRRYYYRFTTGGQVSEVGRTRTAPARAASVDHLRIVFGSCQDWRDGYWTSWPHIVADQPDLVLWLGDYIYEGGVDGAVRDHNSDEVMTLVEYRNRYGLYKADPGLRAAHAAAPWIVTWDDHEVENNYARFTPQDPADQPIFKARRRAAYQAFWEHQPIRSRPEGDRMSLYRTLRWGSLLQTLVLDGRQFRNNQACGTEDLGPDCAERTDPNRTMLGPRQFDWLRRELQADRCRWSMLANQTVMTPVPFGSAYNMDQWDGYPVERSRIFRLLAGVRNAVVITGDIHAAGVGDLREEADGSPVVGTELVTAGISSSFDPALADLAEQLLNGLDQVKWFDAHHNGYVRCDITPTEWRADFRVVESTASPTSTASTVTSWRIADRTPGATEIT